MIDNLPVRDILIRIPALSIALDTIATPFKIYDFLRFTFAYNHSILYAKLYTMLQKEPVYCSNGYVID